MDERSPTRRTVLSGCGTAAIAAIAGCLGGGDSGDDEDGPGADGQDEDVAEFVGELDLAGDGGETFRDWVVPDNPAGTTDEVELVCQYRDFELAEGDAPNLVDLRETRAEEFETTPDRIAGELIVGNEANHGTIVLGAFDRAAIVEAYTAGDDAVVTGEHRGFTVVGDRLAIGEEAIVDTVSYERHIDAAAGATDRLETADPDARLLFELLPSGPETAVSYHQNLPDLAINGETRVAFDEAVPTRAVRTFVFDDADAASPERAHEILASGTEPAEILKTEHHERVVMVEYSP